MKKILRLTASLLVGVLSNYTSIAQTQIGNANFEEWENVGSDNEEPLNWNSFKTASGGWSAFGAKQIERTTDAHSGQYSARIWTRAITVLGNTTLANGNVTLGRINMGSTTPSNPDNYNYSMRTNSAHSEVMQDKPDSLVVWVKYNPANPASEARIAASIHGDYNYRDPQDAASTPYTVAQAILNYTSTNGQWVRKSIPFDYDQPSTDAQYILVTFTTNAIPAGGDANDEVFIDDLELIYNENLVAITPTQTQYLLEGEQGNTLTVTEELNAASQDATITREWKYSTTQGSGYTSFATVENNESYIPEFATIGTYYVVCEVTINGISTLSNEVTIIVSETIPNVVQIAPTATQNISVSTDGTTLTATETPDAGTSREWKYTTTSGSGYMSFISDEFALTYTPNFATTGVYYVVCVSEINGETVTSNEVQINVTDGTSSLGELTQEHIVIYQTESNLVVDLSNATMSDIDMNLYNMDGRLVHSSKLSNSSQNIIQIDFPVGIYVITLSSDKGIYQQKVYVK